MRLRCQRHDIDDHVRGFGKCGTVLIGTDGGEGGDGFPMVGNAGDRHALLGQDIGDGAADMPSAINQRGLTRQCKDVSARGVPIPEILGCPVSAVRYAPSKGQYVGEDGFGDRSSMDTAGIGHDDVLFLERGQREIIDAGRK